jgi:hypothetical protein
MGRSVVRLPAVLVIVATFSAGAGAPAHAAQGVTVRITQLPGEFLAGGPPATVTVSASRSRGGCIKLRWSLVLRVDGARPDRVGVDRIEQDGSFPVDVGNTGDAIRITDRELDPGTLCRDRRVTAQYEISFPGGATEDTAELTLAAEALTAGGQLLDRTTVSREVRPAEAPTSSAPAVAAPAQSGPSVAGAGGGLDARRASDSRVVRVGPVGLAVGVVMVLLGLALLARVRCRSRRLRPTLARRARR